MTTDEISQLPPALTMQQTAKLMGIHYETLRRQRAKGYLSDLKYLRPGPHARVRVLTKSVLRCLDRMTSSEPE